LNVLDQVHCRLQEDTLGHPGNKHDPLSRIRRLLRRGYEQDTQKMCNRMLTGLEAGDVDAQA
jgi:hypothetical protein